MGEVWAAVKGVCDWPTLVVVIVVCQLVARTIIIPSKKLSNHWVPRICAPLAFALGVGISYLRADVTWWFGGWSGLLSLGLQMFLFDSTKDVWPTLIQRLKDAVAIWKKKL